MAEGVMSKKARVKFSPEEDARLAHEVEARPILWDATTDIYKRSDLKPQVWADIATKVGPAFTGEDMMIRYKSLKDTFMKNWRKIQESKSSGSGADDVYRPKWNLFNSLTFLKKVCARSSSTSNIQSHFLSQPTKSCYSPSQSTHSSLVKLELNSQVQSKCYYDENLKEFVIIPSDDSFQASDVGSINDSTSSLTSMIIANGSSSPDLFVPHRPASAPSTRAAASGVKRPLESVENFFTKKGKTKKSGASIMEEAVKVMRDIANQQPPSTESAPNDREEIFGSYIAGRLRIMDDERKKMCENDIMTVLMRY